MLAINLLRTAETELNAARPPHEAGALTAALTDWPDKPGASAPDVYRAKRAMRHRVKAPAAAWSSQDRPGKDGGQERAAEVAGSADASGAGGQPAQQQAGQAHGLPDQAGSAEHPAANAVRDMRLDTSGKGGVAGGGDDSAAHQHGDAGEHEAGQPAPPERGDNDNGAAGAGGRPGQQDQAGGAARGDGSGQPVSAAGGVQPPGGQDNQQSSGRPGDDHPDWP